MPCERLFRSLPLVAALAGVLAVSACVSNPTTPGTQPSSATAGACDDTLWSHVYHPSRLQVLERCKTVSGTVVHLREEADGDTHIQLRPDPQYSDLVNSVNVAEQGGNLVLEPVCVNPVTQADAVDACRGFQNQVLIPRVGEHVLVTGTYVLDTAHGWTEIHPVTQIRETGP